MGDGLLGRQGSGCLWPQHSLPSPLSCCPATETACSPTQGECIHFTDRMLLLGEGKGSIPAARAQAVRTPHSETQPLLPPPSPWLFRFSACLGQSRMRGTCAHWPSQGTVWRMQPRPTRRRGPGSLPGCSFLSPPPRCHTAPSRELQQVGLAGSDGHHPVLLWGPGLSGSRGHRRWQEGRHE